MIARARARVLDCALQAASAACPRLTISCSCERSGTARTTMAVAATAASATAHGRRSVDRVPDRPRQGSRATPPRRPRPPEVARPSRRRCDREGGDHAQQRSDRQVLVVVGAPQRRHAGADRSWAERQEAKGPTIPSSASVCRYMECASWTNNPSDPCFVCHGSYEPAPRPTPAAYGRVGRGLPQLPAAGAARAEEMRLGGFRRLRGREPTKSSVRRTGSATAPLTPPRRFHAKKRRLDARADEDARLDPATPA